MKNITLAKSAGFCFGVNRAVDIANKLADTQKGGCTLGPIIHNKELVEELKNKGIVSVDNIEDVKNYSSVIIRSHGVAKSVIDNIQKLDVELIDATCPFVSKIHKIVAKASGEGKTVIIAGDRNHPEVVGIIGHLNGEYFTFKNEEELQYILEIIPQENNKPICVVAQTTFDVELFKKCVKILKKVYTNAEFFDTICNATSVRQAEAASLAKESDCMIIIGDTHSSNTYKLFSICKSYCENSHLIETADDLQVEFFEQCDKIGVTAGASTPDRIIKEVLDKMTDEIKSGETKESFEEMLEESLKTLNTNERVMGTVVGIAPNEVFVDVGRKQAGFIPLEELSATPISSPEEVVKIGDVIELLIMKTNDQEGTIMLSKKRVDAKKGFEKLEKAYQDKEVLTGVVTEVINGGVIVVANDTRIFVPASQATLNRDDNLEDLKGQEVNFRLIEVSQRGRRQKIIGSIRSVLREEANEAKSAFWNECEVGKKYTGTVRTLTPYGAFVELGGVSGMIHISELSWLRIKHPSEVVNVGDTVEVYVKDINKETKKISLGYKKTEDNPWLILKEQYPVDTVVKAKIAGLTSFGAFANIIPGIDGLIHISQISNKRIEKPADELKVGEEVEAKIIAIDFDKKRVSLSIRALLPEPEVEVKEEKAEESLDDEVVAVAEADGEITVSETVEVEEPVAEAEEVVAEVETTETAEEKEEAAEE
ncbi:MAG: bifunctional 4-hydroxy-3-methylbut-2-enyl diphosphate reductase/30S ribosomal protein S1 [Oscillospiraceae bacterium]|nr:bifunctional 4-hydroxy-3-methylbut-2-enyl diphosphate reductase/30S ribosomal protein S1 [Candidatus Ruminococcus equi]